MSMTADAAAVFLAKAEESLRGAESEFASGRYNNCANRCYYACFQAAIAALIQAGIQPSSDPRAQWSHAFVRARFTGDLINRRKLYPTTLRDVLERTFDLRRTADYGERLLTRTEVSRILRRSQDFVTAVRGQWR